MINVKDKMRGCMIGGAIGDALGYPIEFEFVCKDREVTRFYDDKGIISDDTQMTMFTANAISYYSKEKESGNTDISIVEAVYEAYLDWLDTQKRTSAHEPVSWIKSIQELNVNRDCGRTCFQALDSGKMGTMESPLNNRKGCGSVMRIAPCGLYYDDPHIAGLFAAKCGAITHGHPSGWMASYMCAAMISMITYEDIGIKESAQKALELTEKTFANICDTSSFSNKIYDVMEVSKRRGKDHMVIRQLGEGWNADEAFAIALYSCLKYANSFEDAIICAVNHNGDSDSTGAIAGNIMGAKFGFDALPQYFVQNVEMADVIIKLADDIEVAHNHMLARKELSEIEPNERDR